MDEAEKPAHGGSFGGVICELRSRGDDDNDGDNNLDNGGGHREEFMAEFLSKPGSNGSVIYIKPDMAKEVKEVMENHFGPPDPEGCYPFLFARGSTNPQQSQPLFDLLHIENPIKNPIKFDGLGDFKRRLIGLRESISVYNTIILGRQAAVHEGRRDRFLQVFLVFGSILIGSASLCIVGGISRFKQGDSTAAERAWTMSWLVTGIIIGPISYFAPTITSLFYRNEAVGYLSQLGLLLYATPAVGGLVVVAQMIWAYGSCIQIY